MKGKKIEIVSPKRVNVMNNITEFIDELYLMIDSMANGRVPTYPTRDQYKRLVMLGLPKQNSMVTIWRAIKYLEGLPSGHLQENTDGNSSRG